MESNVGTFECLLQALNWPGVAGFHVMPITPRSKQAVLEAVQAGGMLDAHQRGHHQSTNAAAATEA
jgi:hypothetical protein